MIVKKYLLIGSAAFSAVVTALHGLSHGWIALEEYAAEAYRKSKLYKYVQIIENEGVERSISDHVAEASMRFGVPVPVIRGLMATESTENSEALSLKGAIGLLQVMPANAARCGLRPSELWDQRKNILCGTQIFKEELDTYEGKIEPALKSYNGGPKCVKNRCEESEQHAIKTAKNIAQLVIEG